ncbi:MAG: bifunctional diguanylate cyclase/phosphodiesterase [Clostridia bacterium]|nr:bifunctional diguanylate cyclase/phosphodiesterase [Clostridia bacterium]
MQQVNKDYIKENSSGLSLLALLLSVAFIITLFAQARFDNFTIRLMLVLLQFVICVFSNGTLGKPGYYLSCLFSFIQWMISAYEYFLLDDPNSLYLGLIAATSLLCNIIFFNIVKNNSSKLYALRDMYNTTCEQISRLDTRNRELDLALNRTALIVKNQAAKSSDSKKSLGKSQQSEIQPSLFTTNNFIDSVTTLPNRDRILDQIELFIDDTISFSQSTHGVYTDAFKPITVIYLKLDNLHSFVGNSSHQVVDLFIQGVAHRLRENANEEDIVGRIVSGEFVVISKSITNNNQCLAYCDKLRHSITAFFTDSNNNSPITASAGVAIYPKSARYSGELLKAAESAAKVATDNGGNQNVISDVNYFENYFHGKTNDEINSIFDKAMQKKEIFLVYQPQLSAQGKLLGFEAFVRWNHSEIGYISPTVFLDAATKSGYIYKLSHFIFESVTDTLQMVNNFDSTLKIIMNVSSSQMKAGIVETELRKMSLNVNFENLEFDIPEEMLTTSFNDVKGCIDRVYNKGISLSLDNFGRSFSSLNNIPLLPISAIKLDGNFTSNSTEVTKLLTSSIVSLMNEIDIPVVATGVDNEEQYNMLKEYGCSAFQGKFICAPLKAEELEKYILTNIAK